MTDPLVQGAGLYYDLPQTGQTKSEIYDRRGGAIKTRRRRPARGRISRTIAGKKVIGGQGGGH